MDSTNGISTELTTTDGILRPFIDLNLPGEPNIIALVLLKFASNPLLFAQSAKPCASSEAARTASDY